MRAIAPIRTAAGAGATRASAAVKNGRTDTTAVPAAPARARWIAGQRVGSAVEGDGRGDDHRDGEETRRDEEAAERDPAVVGSSDRRRGSVAAVADEPAGRACCAAQAAQQAPSSAGDPAIGSGRIAGS